MPLTKTDAYQPVFDRLIPDEMAAAEEPGFLDKAKAALATENPIGAFITREDNLPSGRIKSTDYNPWNDLTEQEQLDEEFLDEAYLAETPEELEAVRNQVAKERKNREMLTGVDGTLLAIGAGIVDPINLIPIGGVAYKTYRTGGSVLRSGMLTMSVAGTTAAASEALLHSQQLTRTYGESAVNITAASLLGMALGAGSAKLSKTQFNNLVKETEQAMDTGKPFPVGRSVGAADAWKEVEVKGKSAKVLSKALAFDPLSRVLTGKSQAAKRLLVELAENPIDVDGFTGQAVESAAKVRKDALLYRGLRSNRDIFKQYRKEGGKRSLKQFNEQVTREFRNPGSIEDAFISKAAKAWKSEVYDPQFKAIVEARMLPEDIEVKTAKNYVNRVWNKHKIAANLPTFTETVSGWLIKRQPGLEKVEADDIASQIAGRIMSTPDGMLPYDYKIGGSSHPTRKQNLKSPFKSRVFDIDDDLIDDFLENDIEDLAGRYLRQTSTDIELVNKFGDNKTAADEVVDLTAQKKEVADEFREMMAKAKTEKERIKIESEMNRTLDDIQGILERMRGIYDMPDPHNILHRFMHSARNLNFMRFMGGVTVSSFPDAARLIMADGFFRSFGTLMRPLIRGLKGAKLAADDVKYWGIGTDAITGGRLEIVSDINDYALGGSAFERGLQSMANSFGNLNLMNQWTGLMKTSHAIGMQSRVMDDLLKGVVDPRLGRLGIDPSDAKAIMKQVQKHGYQDGNAWIYNARHWDDQSLAMRWAMALKKESDRVIIVPGQEKPLFMSRETGKTLLQFKSFMMSATQRVLIAGLQGQDAHMVQGLLAMIGMGAMTYALKQVEAGRPVSDDPRQWIAEGIDRSGAIGLLMEINNTVEKVSSNNLGMRPLFGISEGASRYSTRSAKEAMLGPTWGSLLDNTLRVANAATSDYDWTEGDTSAVRRLLPYQNLYGVRTALNSVEKIANEAVK